MLHLSGALTDGLQGTCVVCGQSTSIMDTVACIQLSIPTAASQPGLILTSNCTSSLKERPSKTEHNNTVDGLDHRRHFTDSYRAPKLAIFLSSSITTKMTVV